MTHFELSIVVVVCSLISFCWLSFLFCYRSVKFLQLSFFCFFKFIFECFAVYFLHLCEMFLS